MEILLNSMEMKQNDLLSIDFSTNVPCSVRICELDINSVISQGQSGLPGIRGPKGEKVCVSVFLFVLLFL